MDLSLLERTLRERSEPGFRARQVWEWSARGAPGYDAMTNLPRALRAELATAVPFSTLAVEAERESRDGTVKTLFRTVDGHPVEAVLMRYRDGRRSLCLSSQSGCPLTCTFCATGAMAFGRNLTASEILDQALHFRRLTEVDHAVFMGMGEPMHNLEEVLAAARRLPDLGITHRRTTVSTVGWLPGLRRFVDEVDEPIRLALSLHAANDELRSRIMPVNERYPIADVVAVCRRQVEKTRRRVFVEYVMLAEVNDAPEQARALAELLGRDHFKINLIPYNPWAASVGGQAADARPNTPWAASVGGQAADARPSTPPSGAGGLYEGSSRERIAAFRYELERARVPVTVRLTRGQDIEAACGQLAAAPRVRRRSAPASPPAPARPRAPRAPRSRT
ncbi:MAG TPA: 23S rRNA (adenine(2503)-C(2))-methyltransferase RlmN [Gaiellaceae bacterium]|nr:23S rRNA (adenine(2503)-C(2))-methyltransferase RlmN [Gaiellaceae bacterium]